MDSTWISLMGSTLHAIAYKDIIYVPTGSWCVVLAESEAIQIDHNGARLCEVEAGLMNNGSAIFVSAKFLLPIDGPVGSASKYNMVFDQQDEVYRVSARRRINSGRFPVILPYQSTTDERIPETEENDTDSSFNESNTSTPSSSSLSEQLDWLDDDTDHSQTESDCSAPSLSGSPQDCIQFKIQGAPDLYNDDTEHSIAKSDTTRPNLSRFHLDCFQFAIREESDWLNALDVDSPKGKKAHRTPIDWLNLVTSEDELRIASEWVEDNIDIPEWLKAEQDVEEISTLEEGSKAQTNDIELHPKHHLQHHLQDHSNQDVSHSRQKWYDIDLDAAFPESMANLETEVKDAETNFEYHPGQVILPRTTLKWDEIDLDAAFGGNATDLEDECEQCGQPSAQNCGKNTTVTEGEPELSTIGSPALRRYIPRDIEDEVSKIYDTFPVKFREAPRDLVTWASLKSFVEWGYMIRASRELKSKGLYKRKELEETDRSCDWFWEHGQRPLDVQSVKPSPVVNERVEPPYHHINFLGNPTHSRSSTPLEISFWVTFRSTEKEILDPYSRQGVITAQASRLIDPFVYHWKQDHDYIESDSELRRVVAPELKKVYQNSGTWLGDTYGEGEDMPVNEEYLVSKECLYTADTFPCSLRAPHRVNQWDGSDLIINDGNSNLPKRHYRNADRVFQYSPSKLCMVDFADYDEPENKATIASVQSSDDAGMVVEDSEVPEGVSAQTGEAEADCNDKLKSDTADFQNSASSGCKLGEGLLRILLLAAALNLSETLTEASRGAEGLSNSPLSRRSSTPLSKSTELTVLSDEVSHTEKDHFAKCLTQVPGQDREKVVQSFIDDLPSSRYSDMPEEEVEEETEKTDLARLRTLETALKQGFDYSKKVHSDVSQIPCKEHRNDMLYGSAIIAVGRKALEMTDWFRSSEYESASVKETKASTEQAGLARIRALEARMNQEFDFCKQVEIPYSDVSQIPLKENHKDSLYGPFAIGVGRKAHELTDWVISFMR